MNTITLPRPACVAPAAARGVAPSTCRPRPAPPAAGTDDREATAGWLDRLAAWAEAAPQHHRLGRWTQTRR